jgi:ABC-type Fe3+-hydroxamate transport system substrate-binding protein
MKILCYGFRLIKIAALLFFSALSTSAQTHQDASTNSSTTTNPNSQAGTFQAPTNRTASIAPSAEEIRAACIEGRRSVCGKILKILPTGLIVDSGYTNLLRTPLTRAWLLPGIVSADRTTDSIESNEPNSTCIGLVFVTNLPKLRGIKPKLYDYVIVEGYPAGQFNYSPIGNIQKTVRKYSADLEAAVSWNLKNNQN